MEYYEETTTGGFTYTCSDVFGTIEVKSPNKLEGGELDDLVAAILRMRRSQGTINDTISFRVTKTTGFVNYDILTFVPKLRDGVPIQDIVTAIIASMSTEQFDAFMETLQKHNLLIENHDNNKS